MKKEIYKNPFFKANPVTVLVLGICSSLAVTVKLEPACVMALSVTLVTGFSSLFASLLRNTIPNRIRIIVQLVLVSLFVILIDQFLKATNCIVMGRIEAFALGNKPWPSFVDGIANGLGYGMILVVLAFFRELLGSGCLFGHQIIPDSWYAAGYMNNGLIIMPPMALILVGLIIWIQRSYQKELIEEK